MNPSLDEHSRVVTKGVRKITLLLSLTLWYLSPKYSCCFSREEITTLTCITMIKIMIKITHFRPLFWLDACNFSCCHLYLCCNPFRGFEGHSVGPAQWLWYPKFFQKQQSVSWQHLQVQNLSWEYNSTYCAIDPEETVMTFRINLQPHWHKKYLHHGNLWGFFSSSRLTRVVIPLWYTQQCGHITTHV